MRHPVTVPATLTTEGPLRGTLPVDLYFADWSLVSRPDRLKAVGSDAITAVQSTSVGPARPMVVPSPSCAASLRPQQ